MGKKRQCKVFYSLLLCSTVSFHIFVAEMFEISYFSIVLKFEAPGINLIFAKKCLK